MYALTHCTIHTGEEDLTDYALLIQGDRIFDLVPRSQLDPDLPTLNLHGHHVAPGFIDLQLNGCGGVMFNDSITATTLDTMHQTNLKSGTTSYLPTLITTSDADMITAMAVVSTYRRHNPYSVLGLHLEGPYLNETRKGIHNAAHIRPLDHTMLDQIVQAGGETVRVLTLAPEMVELADIQQLVAAGITVAAGHSNATYEQAIAGFDAGISMATHLFNAMSPWLGRSPGMVGAVFARNEVYAGIIADGYHVHFNSIELARQIKHERLVLVTDATAPAGTHMQSFWIGGQEVFYRDGKCVSADGTLGGSALTMIEAVSNCVNQLGIPLAEALRMASSYPAKAIAVDDYLGYLRPGYIANLTLFNQKLQIVETIDRGQRQVDKTLLWKG